jgi:hypothetical protein
MIPQLTWKTIGDAIYGEPGGYFVRIVRTDVNRISYCVIYRMTASKQSRNQIGTARSITKAKKLAERHANLNERIMRDP